jgi:glycosyltransferase involved in cell wall biosynthesis
LADRVQFIGTRENMESLFKACDAYVMSSRFEGLSMALLEAAATGLAAVVTDVGGNRDLVLDGKTGYVVPPANPQALAGSMSKLMGLPEAERQELGLCAGRHCVDNYRFQAVGEEWVRLYRHFMALNAGQQPRASIAEECALSED